MDIDLNELELDNVSEWPVAAKVLVIIFISLAILFLGYWLDTKKQLQELEVAEQEEIKLRSTFEVKQHKAANLDAYKKQMSQTPRSRPGQTSHSPTVTSAVPPTIQRSRPRSDASGSPSGRSSETCSTLAG